MYTFGPFLPHPTTPLAKFAPPATNEVLKVLAVARLSNPREAKIVVTTGFETLDRQARQRGLMAGANSVMLNVTPPQFKKDYEIYPGRAHADQPLAEQIDETVSLLMEMGRAPTDLGISG
jgi:biotin synthase